MCITHVRAVCVVYGRGFTLRKNFASLLLLQHTRMGISCSFAMMRGEPSVNRVTNANFLQRVLLHVLADEAVEVRTAVAPNMHSFPLRVLVIGQIHLHESRVCTCLVCAC